MHSTPPPTSHSQTAEIAAEQTAEDIRLAISGWFQRTRERGMRIPFVSELLARITRPITPSGD